MILAAWAVMLTLAVLAVLVAVAAYGDILVRRHEPVSGVWRRFAVWVWRRRPKRLLP